MKSEEFLTGEDALAALAQIRSACLDHDGVDPLDEAATLRLDHHGLAGIDAWVHAEGFALRRGDEVELAVTPAARRRGHGTRLAAAACARRGFLTAWSHGDHRGAASLAARFDFVRERELWVMRRAAGDGLAQVQRPAGVKIRSFEPADAQALLAVNRDAFADHPEQGALDLPGLDERMAEPWFDPAGLLLAVDQDDELLGFHWTKQHSEALGEVYVVGVSPQAQGRGLGRVLTLAGLRYLFAQGVGEVLLYVEADNAPARRLYEHLGFGHAATDTHVQYQRRAQR
ncbi:MAG: mycothiol synthase [Nocardioidaceae bacterium]|nr:mycothiol synthase [Nocardioidaceae bacterium]